MRRMFPLGPSLLALLLASGCFESGASTPPSTSDADTDVDADTDTDTDTDTEPLDLSERLDAGQARTGQITREDELVGGLKPEGRIGDYKIYNSRIQVVIEGARMSDGWGVFGGTIADADVVRPEGEPEQSLFGEYIWGYNLRLVDPAQITVINDGGDGQAAILRVSGPDNSLPFLDALLGDVLPSDPLAEEVTVDYILQPDSNVLEIQTTIENTGTEILDMSLAFHAFFLGDGLRYYRPGSGFDYGALSGGTSLLGASSPDVSYGFFLPDDEMTLIMTYEGMCFCSSEGKRLRSGRTWTFSQYFIVAAGGVDPLLRAYHEWAGTASRGQVSGTVFEADGVTPAPGAKVNVLMGADPSEAHIDQTFADAEGRYTLELDAGTHFLVPYLAGHALSTAAEVSVSAGASVTQDLTLPACARASYAVTDPLGSALPAKLTFDRQEGQIATPDSFGDPRAPSGYQDWIHSHTGSGSVDLPPGSYIVTASRGFEYEIDQQLVTLTAGETTALTFQLARTVDTPGYVSCDFHIHTMASPDSDVMYEDRAASAVSEGVEAPLATDHDVIADWGPTAEAMGLAEWVHPLIGEEITTYMYGHFQAWPLIRDPSLPNDGAFSWYDKWAPELFAEVAAYPTAPILMANHPRSMSIGGYFSAVEYDRDSFTFGREHNWSAQFDAIEIINGKGVGTARDETLPDWYAFLNHGYRFAGASGSDTHSLSSEVGSVRSWVRSSTDLPAQIDPIELRDSVRSLDTLVSTGPYIEVSIGEATLGDDTSVPFPDAVNIQVRVQAPTWMDVHTLEVIGNGEVVHTQALDESTADADNPVIRFDDEIEVDPSQDTWYVVKAYGSRSMSPVSRGAQPFAFTNPIFVDRDDDGQFTPLYQ